MNRTEFWLFFVFGIKHLQPTLLGNLTQTLVSNSKLYFVFQEWAMCSHPERV